MSNQFESKKPEVKPATPTAVAPAAKPVEAPKQVTVPEHKTHQQSVMEFLKQISKEVKDSSPHLPVSLADKIDAYIKDHGNRYPETTGSTPVVSK